jgi:hypothetical protein
MCDLRNVQPSTRLRGTVYKWPRDQNLERKLPAAFANLQQIAIGHSKENAQRKPLEPSFVARDTEQTFYKETCRGLYPRSVGRWIGCPGRYR